MVRDEMIRKKAVSACKTYGPKNKFICPVCGSVATAQKDKQVGMMLVECPGCPRTVGFKL